jgi:hypothetical protein
MSVRSSVVTALTPTAPVYWQKWSGDTEPPALYFVFTTMTVPDEWNDDAQKTRKTYVYLNLYSETDYMSLVPAIRTAMEAAGFAPVDEQDVQDTDYRSGAHDSYHLSMTWSIREVV